MTKLAIVVSCLVIFVLLAAVLATVVVFWAVLAAIWPVSCRILALAAATRAAEKGTAALAVAS